MTSVIFIDDGTAQIVDGVTRRVLKRNQRVGPLILAKHYTLINIISQNLLAKAFVDFRTEKSGE